MTTLLAAVFVFAVIVLIHEFGHFITAKLVHMKVLEFSVGFGPKLCSVRKGETMYSLRILPLGGFNRIQGMSRSEARGPRDFINRPVWQRLIVIAAGSVFNFLLAYFLMAGILYHTGIQSFPNEPVIGNVLAGSPAQNAGLDAGDRIISIDGQPVAKWTDISPLIPQAPHSPVNVEVERNQEHFYVSLIPEEKEGRAVMGIAPYIETKSITPVQAFVISGQRFWLLVKAVFQGLASMVTGQNLDDVAGPVGIARMAGTVAENGIIPLLLFVAFLSLNLGLLNLLPIPLLDGGILLFTLIEGITGRELPEKAMSYINMIGIFILGALFVFAMTNDISSLFK